MEKKEQNEIANDQKQEGAHSENCLMSEVKVKNQFLNEVKKNRKRIRKSYIEHIKLQMGGYYETKPLRARTLKRRKNNLVEAEQIAEMNGETLQRRKTDKAEVTLKHLRQRKKLLEKKNSKEKFKVYSISYL